MCRLRKSLYGLKQSAKNWQKFLTSLMRQAKFENARNDSAIFLRLEKITARGLEKITSHGSVRSEHGTAFCVVATHVDDIFPLFNSAGRKLRDELFQNFSKNFEISDLGDVSWCLKTAILRDRVGGVLKVSQELYIHDFLE